MRQSNITADGPVPASSKKSCHDVSLRCISGLVFCLRVRLPAKILGLSPIAPSAREIVCPMLVGPSCGTPHGTAPMLLADRETEMCDILIREDGGDSERAFDMLAQLILTVSRTYDMQRKKSEMKSILQVE